MITSAPGWPCVYAAHEEESYFSAIHKASGPAEMAVQATADAQATVVRGTLDWTGTLAVLYDMGGRRVLDVHRGANDVSGLNPGVYFVRLNGVRRGTYARKVIITRYGAGSTRSGEPAQPPARTGGMAGWTSGRRSL